MHRRVHGSDEGPLLSPGALDPSSATASKPSLASACHPLPPTWSPAAWRSRPSTSRRRCVTPPATRGPWAGSTCSSQVPGNAQSWRLLASVAAARAAAACASPLVCCWGGLACLAARSAADPALRTRPHVEQTRGTAPRTRCSSGWGSCTAWWGTSRRAWTWCRCCPLRAGTKVGAAWQRESGECLGSATVQHCF